MTAGVKIENNKKGEPKIVTIDISKNKKLAEILKKAGVFKVEQKITKEIKKSANIMEFEKKVKKGLSGKQVVKKATEHTDAKAKRKATNLDKFTKGSLTEKEAIKASLKLVKKWNWNK